MAFRDGKLISRDVLAVELTFVGLKSPPQNDMIHVKDDTSKWYNDASNLSVHEGISASR